LTLYDDGVNSLLITVIFLPAGVRGSKRVSDFVQARPGLGACSRRKRQRL